jgi:hypothetical protein
MSFVLASHAKKFSEEIAQKPSATGAVCPTLYILG